VTPPTCHLSRGYGEQSRCSLQGRRGGILPINPSTIPKNITITMHHTVFKSSSNIKNLHGKIPLQKNHTGAKTDIMED